MTTALNTALGACFKAGQIPAAVTLYDKSIATGIVKADVITYTTLMNTLASGMFVCIQHEIYTLKYVIVLHYCKRVLNLPFAPDSALQLHDVLCICILAVVNSLDAVMLHA
jgi:hypothetical protein